MTHNLFTDIHQKEWILFEEIFKHKSSYSNESSLEFEKLFFERHELTLQIYKID